LIVLTTLPFQLLIPKIFFATHEVERGKLRSFVFFI
jgi:hypothetical protein